MFLIASRHKYFRFYTLLHFDVVLSYFFASVQNCRSAVHCSNGFVPLFLNGQQNFCLFCQLALNASVCFFRPVSLLVCWIVKEVSFTGDMWTYDT